MTSRKVVKIKESFYVNIPLEISKGLGIVKGDKLRISPLVGLGLLITLEQGADKIPVNLESVDRLQRAADFIYEQLKDRLKDLDSNFISGLHLRIIDDLVRSGIFDLKARVEKVEKRVEESNKGKGRLTLVPKGRRNDH
jgi:hypothetical protein